MPVTIFQGRELLPLAPRGQNRSLKPVLLGCVPRFRIVAIQHENPQADLAHILARPIGHTVSRCKVGLIRHDSTKRMPRFNTALEMDSSHTMFNTTKPRSVSSSRDPT